ncbi:MAG: MaoC/PaaZ C-terminal domain-containing protein [Patulibacter minatonensis]
MSSAPTKVPGLIGSYGKAALAALPLAGKLPLLPGGGGPLPSTILRRASARLEPNELQALRDVTEDHGGALPLLAPHHLAFPLHMQGMTDGAFPYPAIGTVHLDNVVERTRVIAPDELLNVDVRFVGPYPHRKGATFTIETTATSAGELVWRERSTMLRIGAKVPAGSAELPVLEVPDQDAAPSKAKTETWSLPENLGRVYGGVSGDRNPIHLHPLSAKAFGFPRAIAHGMWTASRIAAALGDDLPTAATLAVRFERPILLPGKVQLARWKSGATTDLLVLSEDGSRIHARARLTEGPSTL